METSSSFIPASFIATTEISKVSQEGCDLVKLKNWFPVLFSSLPLTRMVYVMGMSNGTNDGSHSKKA